MSRPNQSQNYLGNPNIKKDGITQNWTKEEVQEYALCMKDPVYFIEKYAKIISLDVGCSISTISISKKDVSTI